MVEMVHDKNALAKVCQMTTRITATPRTASSQWLRTLGFFLGASSGTAAGSGVSSTATAAATPGVCSAAVVAGASWTGGYIPGVGIVVTAEVEQLASDGIVGWATGIVEDSPMVISLLGNEEVVFLLDIASPSRTSRLIALTPSDLDADGDMTRREAPATSTAPLLPTFDDTPERLASVDEEGNE